MDWRKHIVTLGKEGKQAFENFPGAKVQISKMLEFLGMRPGPPPHCRPIAELLDRPENIGEGWFRLPWKDFDEANLPERCNFLDAMEPGPSDWQTAFLGKKIEALYATMWDGRLRASDNTRKGTRYAEEAHGVYVHGLKCSKSQNYAQFVPLCNDGVLRSAK